MKTKIAHGAVRKAAARHASASGTRKTGSNETAEKRSISCPAPARRQDDDEAACEKRQRPSPEFREVDLVEEDGRPDEGGSHNTQAKPAALAIWHGSNLAEPETARDYLKQGGDLWQRTPDAIAFVRWLHTHPIVLAERVLVLECPEALSWEHDFDKRQTLVLREEAARARIGDVLSAEIVRKKPDHHGRLIEPWRYQRTRF